MQKLTPFLWFDNQAEDAAKFYTSVFKNSKMGAVTRYGEGGPAPAGSVMTAEFMIEGTQFVGLNGGPHFSFTPAVSFVINCETQEEVDHYWNKLSEGGSKEMCGWLKDRFGLSWQVVPQALPALLQHRDAGKRTKVMQAMMKMQKIVIRELEDAAA